MRPLLAIAGLAGVLSGAPGAPAQEFRGLWVDAFHGGLRSPDQVTSVVAAARAKNANAVIAQVRKRGDAYFQGGLEPVATDVVPGFDPLADLIAKAHDTTGGKPRLEVHVWLVTYNIWNRQSSEPSQPDHPYRRFPEWVSRKYQALPTDPVVQWDGANYPFDQGVPAVQQHTFEVAMDIVRRYAIDGLHFDYLRYSDDSSLNYQPWGYHPESLARFNALKNRAGTPSPGDSQWLQWRRDQVTALLRKTYLHVLAEKPRVRVSAALICYDPAPSLSAGSWNSSSAYARVLQDWRAWLEEGILDLGCPMAYKTNNTSVADWTAFARDRQYNRASALGLGWYLNPIEQSIEQIKLARTAGPSGRRLAGLIGYSYAVTNSEDVPASTFRDALTDDLTAELYDPGGTPVFAEPSTPPGMPWKSDATRAHLMGTLHHAAGGAEKSGRLPIDGAVVTLSGPMARTLVSDGTGFFGAVDLPAGKYVLTVSGPGLGTRQLTVDLAGAAVNRVDMALGPPALEILSHALDPATGRLSLTWASEPGDRFAVEFSRELQSWTALATGIPSGGLTTSYQSPPLPAGTSSRFWRVRKEEG